MARFFSTRRALGLWGAFALVAVVGFGAAQQLELSESERPERLVNSVLAEGGACAPDTETLCLHGGRYEVRADYWTSDGDRAAAQVVPKGTSDSGLFRFFDAENWEMLIKVLDGCAVNDYYWVFGASTTDLGYAIRVTDTVTGDVKEYTNEPGRPAPAITDAKAFPDSCNARRRPELVSPGSIAAEYGVWESDVTYDGFSWSFAADFDGDGDDDVMLPGGRHFEAVAAESGVILLNNGDFAFEVAAGDRPRGVHPREVLIADFNGDGANDFFIADHGYDRRTVPRLAQPAAAVDRRRVPGCNRPAAARPHWIHPRRRGRGH